MRLLVEVALNPSSTFLQPQGGGAAPPPRAHTAAAQHGLAARGTAARICASKSGFITIRAIASRPRPEAPGTSPCGALGVAAHIDQHRIATCHPIARPARGHITGIALVSAPRWLASGSGVMARARTAG
ncbi:MAG: hypothetical protein R3E55_08205 [Burkholderiaceae bacterium]